jgi:hypothetical protein
MKFVLNSKIFRATVTQSNVKYEGSITIDANLCDKAGFWIGEKVLVVSNITGAFGNLRNSWRCWLWSNLHERSGSSFI